MRTAILLACLAAVGCPEQEGVGPVAPNTSNGGGPNEDARSRPEQQPRVVLAPSGADEVSVAVEIARTARERQRGLMFREHLGQNEGMLFLWERPEHLSFWMRNTYIPLDMIFIAPDKRVLGVVENAEPLTEERRSVSGISQYVLEVNAGFARRHDIVKGTPVRFVGVEGVDDEPR